MSSLPNRPLPPESQRGFTLLELLVAMVVMGIAIGLVMVNFMPDDRTLVRNEAEQLALLLENAALEGRISGRPLAWSRTQSGYVFWRRNDNNDWERIEASEPFRGRRLPDGMTISLVRLAGQPLSGSDRLSFNSYALPQPFDIRIGSTTTSLYIIGNTSGEITIQNDAPAFPANDHAQS